MDDPAPLLAPAYDRRGQPGEPVVSETTSAGFLVRELPRDSLAVRISIGRAHEIEDTAYLVYRGERHQVERLLKRALAALRKAPR